AQQYQPKDRERFMQYLQQEPMAAAQLRAPLYEDKVVDFLFEKAEITDRTVTREELEAAIESEDGAPGHVHGPGCGHDHHDHDHDHAKPKKAAAKKADAEAPAEKPAAKKPAAKKAKAADAEAEASPPAPKKRAPAKKKADSE
ncbi:MAG: trigger factor, partial [Sphingomonadaceae bacterium]